MRIFTIFLITNRFFPGGGSFSTDMCKFLISDSCVDVVPINAWSPSELTLWFFCLCFKLLSIIFNSNVCYWILIILRIIWRLFFNAVSRFLMYSRSVSRQHSVSGLWVKCHINVFIIYVVTKWNWNRDCKNIRSHVRSLSVLFAKFLNSADSISHNKIGYSILPNVVIMIFGWYLKILFDKVLNMT